MANIDGVNYFIQRPSRNNNMANIDGVNYFIQTLDFYESLKIDQKKF